MSNPSGNKGWMAENAVVQYLRGHGFPHSERRSKKGNKDQGDILSAPGLVWEVKYNGKSIPMRMAEWMRQTDVEVRNAKAEYGILVIKPAGIGEKNAKDFLAVMRMQSYERLYEQAITGGYQGVVLSTTHSNARISELPARISSLKKQSTLWTIYIPARGQREAGQGLVVRSLGQAVELVRAAGFGEPLPSD
jgi:hypothetical protein